MKKKKVKIISPQILLFDDYNYFSEMFRYPSSVPDTNSNT